MLEVEEVACMFDKSNFPITQVSIVAQEMQSKKEVHGYVSAGNVAKAGSNTAGWVGGIFGLLIGAAFIWVPSFGRFDRIPHP